VAQAAGPVKFADQAWAQQFAGAAAAILGKPAVYVDVPSLSITF
jgi:hypothetical protein